MDHRQTKSKHTWKGNFGIWNFCLQDNHSASWWHWNLLFYPHTVHSEMGALMDSWFLTISSERKKFQLRTKEWIQTWQNGSRTSLERTFFHTSVDILFFRFVNGIKTDLCFPKTWSRHIREDIWVKCQNHPAQGSTPQGGVFEHPLLQNVMIYTLLKWLHCLPGNLRLVENWAYLSSAADISSRAQPGAGILGHEVPQERSGYLIWFAFLMKTSPEPVLDKVTWNLSCPWHLLSVLQ